jgi:hypothetical protein
MGLAKFGIPLLDEALGGGIPRGSVVLLEEEVGTKPDYFFARFISQGLKKGESAYILNTEHSPRLVTDTLSHFGLDTQTHIDDGSLILIDGFTKAFGWGEFESDCEHTVKDLSNIREVHDVVRKAVLHINPKNNLRGVVDSLSTLIMRCQDERELFGYVHHQMAAQKNYGNILFYTIHFGAQPDYMLQALEHIVDGVVELRRVKHEERWKAKLLIKKMRRAEFSTRELLYEILGGEIKIGWYP